MIQAQAVPVLSDSQRRVVEALGEGPVKVEAAAGSGKTTAMAALFVAAVERGYPIPQIMAVTFTKRAAAELQRKIALALGGPLAEEAGSALPLDGAWIGTFHALVQRLLHEHAYRVGLPRDLQLLDELGARLVMDETLDEVRAAVVDDGSLLERLPPEPDLRTMSRLVPEAGAAVLRLRSTPLGGDQVAELSRAAYGRWRELGDPEAQLSWHGAALYLLEMVWRNYERRLRERGATDFDGLLRLGLGVLGPGTPLGEWARRHFRLVIVDEYQDTSALQEVLIGQLAGPAQRGLFMVGDARQSIYAFRDAKPGIMAEARGMPLPLFENHRSRWSILRAADQVIRRDPHFAGDPEMEATRGSEPWVPVRVAPAESRLAEAEGIASTLAELHASGLVFPDGSSQGLQWKDMAVLAYTLGSLGPYLEEALRRREIPFQTQSGLLLERPEVKDALAFLRLAADEEDDLAALRCLQVRACRLPDRALMALAPGSGPGRLAISSRLRRHLGAGAPGWEPDWRERGERLLAWVEQIREVARMRPPSAVLALTLELTGIMRLEVARAGRGEPLGNRAQAALWELGQVLRQVEAAGSAASLGAALEELQVLVREARKGEPPPAGDQDQVTLSTIHGAKGLEWPVVLLADCRPYWDHGTPLVLWDREEQAVVCARVGGEHTAAYSRWRSSDQAQVESAERRRLVYVAMTRARDLLIVSSCHRDTGQGEFSELLQVGLEGRPWLSAWPGFGSEAAPADHQAGTSGAIPAPAPTPPPTLSAGMAAARWAELKSLTSPAAGAADPEQLSFSSLQTLSQCPRQFWFRHVARFPDPSDFGTGPGRDLGRGPDRAQARALGERVHQALERLHREHPDRGPTPEEGAAAGAQAAAGLDPEPAARARRMVLGYATSAVAALATVAVECQFSWPGWSGQEAPPLVGVIDRVARGAAGELLVLDYKTNRELGELELSGYARQLQLYAAALGAGALGAPVAPVRAQLLWLERGRAIEVDCGSAALRGALDWARAGAERVTRGRYRSVDEFPERPCPSCPFAPHCAERRLEPSSVGAGVGDAEESG